MLRAGRGRSALQALWEGKAVLASVLGPIPAFDPILLQNRERAGHSDNNPEQEQ